MSVSRVYGLLVSCGEKGILLRRIKYWTTTSTRGDTYNGDSYLTLMTLRRCSSKIPGDSVSIGDVSKPVSKPQKAELVPVKYIPANSSQVMLRHLRWIMQKDLLGQDVFLIGSPGPLRRQIAMMYLEMTKREVEYISLSRDTTESDLKQRREILAGTARYVDQCAVEAAVKGRVLVLEGIEKAERNVLPVLNNLLENREMQLDDGKFLVAASRYDQLLQDHTKEELDGLKLVRVSENFRVIALGLPVPRYKGNPLDPPLRSRFQARGIQALPFKEHLEALQEVGQKIPSNTISQMLSFASTMLTEESTNLGLPDFPIDNLETAITILNNNPNLSMADVLQRVYPYKTMLNKEGIQAVEGAMQKFELHSKKKKNFSVAQVEKDENSATVRLKSGFSSCDLQVPAGKFDPLQVQGCNKFVKTAYHDNVIAEMFQSHATKDFCLIGPKGCGKSILIQNMADSLGYHIEPIHLHQDMTSRDLLQQRMTHPNGDTSWMPSPLVSAALNGNLAVLDGVHRINHGSFSVLHRLIHDRELQLYDGTRLLRQDRYEAVKKSTGKTDEDMKESKIFPIHPSFRIVAVAEPPVIGSSKQQWLTPEILTMFLYHNVRLLSLAEEEQVLKTLVPDCPDMTRLLNIVQKLRASSDPTISSLASSLSTRQLLRIAHRQAVFPSEDLGAVIEKSCLARFLPQMARSALEQCLEESGIEKPLNVANVAKEVRTCEVVDGMVRIRETSVPIFKPENLTKVPNIVFYENPQHLAVMEDMLKDYSLGEHLLLVGNQGVGKNKIVDRFLQLLNRPREYLQLHRDTTVQTLTLQPTVQGGVITYEDSPLVRAVKEGNVLVIDEADKAPTQVTCILKTLVESGEMHMADGRRIVSAKSTLPPSPNVIVAHPDFRMIVLANRPGFPFLGNDFFGAMGDIFSCHAIDNPDADSEMAMLRQYGPDVPDPTLEKLVMAFGELRDMADQGLIAYPYSTREVVNMVKHLQKFPLEGLTTIVKNVFDFDSFNNELRETIIDVMKKHGIPLGANQANVQLSKEFLLPPFEKVGHWKVDPLSSRKRGDMFSCPAQTKPINVKGPVQLPHEKVALNRHEARSSMFSELESQWLLPFEEGNIVSDLAVSKGVQSFSGQMKTDVIHIATSNPIGVYSMSERSMTANLTDLYNVFPSVGMSYRPKVKLVPLLSPLDDTLILHESHTNAVMSINYITGEVARLKTDFLPEVTVERKHFLRYGTKTKKEKDFVMLSSTIPGTNIITFYESDGDSIVLLDPLQSICHQISVPVNIRTMQLVDSNKWILTDSESNQKYNLTWSEVDTFQLQPIHEENVIIENCITHASTRSLDDTILNKALQEQISCPNRVLVTPKTDAVIILGYPELEYSQNEIYVIPRDGQSDGSISSIVNPSKTASNPVDLVVILQESGQIVRAIETEKVPKSAEITRDELLNASAFLEVIDLVNRKKRYIRVPSSDRNPSFAFWLMQPNKPNFFLASLSNDGLVTVDSAGCVQLWETSLIHLERSLQEWRNMIGYEDTRPLQINYERESGKETEGPKHGKIDLDNMPHVGGNTWAGGTGGRDTAGLGGIGGPYRLDAGHDVYQVTQVEKDAVPEEIKRAAREMAEKAWKERLREIEMSEYDAETYENFAKTVRRQIHSLRVILDSLQAKGKERQWLKHQTYGDLDDTKLIEGITGEKSIYKRRGDQEPELGTPQELPKKLRLVVDVSGSMYRFNGHDGRLEREMSAVLMVMEALEGYENKFKYEIVGHSGESYDTSLVRADKVPKNNKERLSVLKTMHAHSQFCLSGDHTLEATKDSISSVLKEEADEYFVIILSDANFERYGIRPQTFARLLTENDEVNAFAIFIGSLGDQAIRLTKQLPMGRAYVCMDTDKLPQILQQIFTSTMLSSS